MFSRLLVGLDGSPGAEAALTAAIELARRFKSTIVLAAITDVRLLEAPRFRMGYDFLALRAASGEVPADLEAWWRAFQSADPETRQAMLLPETGVQKRRRRRRRKKPAAPDGPTA